MYKSLLDTRGGCHAAKILACSKRSDSEERCEVKKAIAWNRLQKYFQLAFAVPRTSGAEDPYCKLEVHIWTLPQPTFPHECAVSITCVFKSQYNRGCLRAYWLQTVYDQGHTRDAWRERARSFPLLPSRLCFIYRNLK